MQNALDRDRGTISYQVIHECLNVFTRRLKRPLTPEAAAAFMHSYLLPLCRVFPDAALYESALLIQGRYGFGFYDSLIIAGAKRAGCRLLLSEDLQHGQVIDGIEVENPFLRLR